MTIWDKFPDYDENELKLLVRMTAEVLADAGEGGKLPPDVLQISNRTAAREIRQDLSDSVPSATVDQIQKLLTAPDISRRICLKILDEVRRKPELSEVIDALYQEQSRKMGGPLLLLAAAPLLLLMIRVKKVGWRRKGGTGGGASFSIEMNDAGASVMTLVKGLVSGLVGA